MTQGKKPIDPLFVSDVEVLAFLDLIEAIGNGAEIESDAPVRQLTSVSFARLAETAVEQNASVIRQGKLGEYRKRARTLVESALAEECWFSGIRSSLDALLEVGDISATTFSKHVSVWQSHHSDIWRKAATQCAIILRDLEKARVQKGKRGRPKAARNGDALAQLLDSGILRDAANSVPESQRDNRDTIADAIPNMVREYTRSGQLHRLGETDQENIDRHSKRLRNKLDHSRLEAAAKR